MGDCEAVIGLDGRKEERQKVGFWQRPDHQKSILFQEHLVRENHHCFKNGGGKEGPRNKEKHKVTYLQYL